MRITETNDDKGQPRTIAVRARSSSLTLDLRFDVASMVTSRMQGALANGVDFLQMRGQYTVSGEAGTRKIAFTAPGAAETFRGNVARRVPPTAYCLLPTNYRSPSAWRAAI